LQAFAQLAATVVLNFQHVLYAQNLLVPLQREADLADGQ
jgi:hypothetical protein